jgi:hypothetical protein
MNWKRVVKNVPVTTRLTKRGDKNVFGDEVMEGLVKLENVHHLT